MTIHNNAIRQHQNPQVHSRCGKLFLDHSTIGPSLLVMSTHPTHPISAMDETLEVPPHNIPTQQSTLHSLNTNHHK
jgi:hypothetical protein